MGAVGEIAAALPETVKSKRMTPMPWAAGARPIRTAASDSFVQVKQCANSA